MCKHYRLSSFMPEFEHLEFIVDSTTLIRNISTYVHMSWYRVFITF